jgi:signal transduction histidine kinase
MLNPVTLVYHEVRAPIGLLTTAARALADDCEDESMRRRCEIVVRAAERVMRISNQVLDLAASTRRANDGPCIPADTVTSVVSGLSDLGVPVTHHPGPGVRGTESSAPAAQLEAVLHSLIMNALDHGAPGCPIQVSTDVVGDALSIEVSNPIGPSGHRGLGLGMYLCQEVVKTFGGELEAHAAGSQYSVELRIPVATACLSS